MNQAIKWALVTAALAGLAAGLTGVLPIGSLHAQTSGAASTAPTAGQTSTSAPQVSRAYLASASSLPQYVIDFESDAQALGDSNAEAPYELRCQPAQAGQGRWQTTRRWVFQFEAALPTGTRCSATPTSAWRKRLGPGARAAQTYSFEAQTPKMTQARPSGGRIDPEQVFLLAWSGDVDEKTLWASAFCRVEGLADRIPLVALSAKERESVVPRTEFARNPATTVSAARCGQVLPENAKVSLIIGAVAQRHQHVKLEFLVRGPFEASLTCSRDCSPITPMMLQFSEPVPQSLALQIKLQAENGQFIAPKPTRGEGMVDSISFPTPLLEKSTYRLAWPKNLRDEFGRELKRKPESFTTGTMPPLAKFHGQFGVLEWREGGVLPLTLRQVQTDLLQQQARGQADLRVAHWRDDRGMILALRRYQYLGHDDTDTHLTPKKGPDGEPVSVQARALSLLGWPDVLGKVSPQPQYQNLALPEVPNERTQVVGIPLKQPGLHLVELRSELLARDLMVDPNVPKSGETPMFVRTAALVTNLGVHFKQSSRNSLVWVTALDSGRAVAGAKVQVSDCDGELLWQGTTDQDGLAHIKRRITAKSCPVNEVGPDALRAGLPPIKRRPGSGLAASQALFVSARLGDDVSFALDGWHDGIETWRFNVYTETGRLAGDEDENDRAASTEPTRPAKAQGSPDFSKARWTSSTVLDRVMVRAGDTVSMKHFVRREVAKGLAYPPQALLPQQVVLSHDGSGDQYKGTVSWNERGSGISSVKLPKAAKRGSYSVILEASESQNKQTVISGLAAANFTVSDFRLPAMLGQLAPDAKGPLAGVTDVSYRAQIAYANGGPAAGLATQLSANLQPITPQFDAYSDFSFAQEYQAPTPNGAARPEAGVQILAERQGITLDAQGQMSYAFKNLKTDRSPKTLELELTYPDPNGEQQTLGRRDTLWPSQVVLGVSNQHWEGLYAGDTVKVVALTPQGKPQAGVAISVTAVLRENLSYRQRVIGGFYSYENKSVDQALGTICEGRSDARGLVFCKIAWPSGKTPQGSVYLIASAKDAQGRAAEASQSFWVPGPDDNWYGGQNLDRVDVIPDQTSYRPGDVAKLQVRTPFRRAEALVTIEREGIVHTQRITVRSNDPTISIPITEDMVPNAFVSVMLVRGRVQPVTWWSFFTWGWRQWSEWWDAWQDARETPAPSAMVDLAKPAYRLGLAEVKVALSRNTLKVEVEPSKTEAKIREQVPVKIRVTTADGQPAKGGEVVFFAVDEALLALQDNSTVNLLEAMFPARPLTVENATNQMQVVGKRHFGLKAMAVGGSGGREPTRELLDTLLTWMPRVTLDQQGSAQVMLPLNDQLSRFRLIAVADWETDRFGFGQASLTTQQDVQVISGLPPILREGDNTELAVTVRNGTDRVQRLKVSAQGQATSLGLSDPASSVALFQPQADGRSAQPVTLQLPEQSIELAPHGAQVVRWPWRVPSWAAQAGEAIDVQWTLQAREDGKTGKADSGQGDRVQAKQRWMTASPVVADQSQWLPLKAGSAGVSLPVSLPANARPGYGGVQVGLLASLTDGGKRGLQQWFASYPYECLEQQTSRAVVMNDARLWQAMLEVMPSYLDRDGLASWFPIPEDGAYRGDELLTAYILSVSQASGFKLPADLAKRMEDALIQAIQGRIGRRFSADRAGSEAPIWRRNPSLLLEQRLQVLQVLAQLGRLQNSWLSALEIRPEALSTRALIDWLLILQASPSLPDRAAQLKTIGGLLRSKLQVTGTRLSVVDEGPVAWWSMGHYDVDAARLLWAVLWPVGSSDDAERSRWQAAWNADAPALVQGLVARQRRSGLSTTVGNAWGAVAYRSFDRAFPSPTLSGQTLVQLADQKRTVNHTQANSPDTTVTLPWPTMPSNLSVVHQGEGNPWIKLTTLISPLKPQAIQAGYRLSRELVPVQQKLAGKWSVGDVVEVRLQINVGADQGWVVLSDPIPAGASLLGSGTARDSRLAQAAAVDGDPAASAGASVRTAWPRYEERLFEGYRAYFETLTPGVWGVRYRMRLNQAGEFQLPPSRVEAMYAPDVFATSPLAPLSIRP